MTENEVAQILKALGRIESNQDRIESNQDRLRLLVVGNGDDRAVLPRLRSLEFFVKVLKWLSPIITVLISGALMYAIFGTP